MFCLWLVEMRVVNLLLLVIELLLVASTFKALSLYIG